MFGSEVDPKYKLKGAEANWFVGFVVLLLEQRGHVLGEERQILLALGQDLLRLLDLMRIHLFQLPPDAHQARSDRSVLSRLIIDRGHLGPRSPLPPTADHREAFVDHTIHAQRMWALCNLPEKPKLHNWQHLAVGIVGGLDIRQNISHAIVDESLGRMSKPQTGFNSSVRQHLRGRGMKKG